MTPTNFPQNRVVSPSSPVSQEVSSSLRDTKYFLLMKAAKLGDSCGEVEEPSGLF